MPQYLTLSDGTLLRGYALAVDNVLWVYVHQEIDFGALFGMLNDPEKTGTIASQGQTYTGYTELFCIRKETGGFYTAGIRK